MTQTNNNPDLGPTGKPSLVPAIVVGTLAAIVTIPVYRGVNLLLSDQLVPGLLVGLIIGLAIRFTAKRHDSRLRPLAVAITVPAFIIGFIVVDSFVWTPFDLKSSIQRLFTLQALAVHAVTLFIAHGLASLSAKRQ